MPCIWTLGIMSFSTGLFIGGAGGEPRRTNMGLSYTDPQSPLYHADWQYAKVLGSVGGTIMTVAALLFFIAYAPPSAQTLRSNFPGARPFTPDSPLPISAPPNP